jgi:hypothetical protein
MRVHLQRGVRIDAIGQKVTNDCAAKLAARTSRPLLLERSRYRERVRETEEARR